ncbi:hypothetical protein [Sphaerisporangium dianthi]|uniref:MFS transporter n=1 Tax=Sphaerisporangium dianthi TaxID=1436120 RepID=A0ABV9CGV1_9ACTN
MAVPPLQAAGLSTLGRINRLPLVLDVVVGLLTAIALPLAIVVVPNTISVVSALLPADLAGVWILRAHGLALPVMLCTVPLAGVALRRFSVASMLLAGLACLALADVAGGFADSTAAVGVLRVLHGVGAGVLIPATFAAGYQRPGASRDVLVPFWAAALAVSLLAAQALALWPLDAVTSWRVTLQPYPLLTGVALALAAIHLVLWRAATDAVPPLRMSSRTMDEAGGPAGADDDGPGRALRSVREPSASTASTAASAGPDSMGPDIMALDLAGLDSAGPDSAGPDSAGPDSAGRAHLGPAAGLSAGIAVLAFGTTFDWPSGVILAAAAIAVVTLLAMAGLGRVEGPGGRVVSFVMIAVGLVVLPTAAQVTYVELGGLGGPGLSGLWVPFGLATVIAFVAASAAGRAGLGSAQKLVGVGLVTMVVGLCAVRLFVPSTSGMPLVMPFSLLAAGAAVAVVSAVRGAGYRAALFGLSLCFPAVLCGFLLGTGIQVGRLRAVSSSGQVTPQAMVDGFVGALHIWALVAGFTVVIALVLGAVLARRGYDTVATTVGDGDGDLAVPRDMPVKTPSMAPGEADDVSRSPRRSTSRGSDVKVASQRDAHTMPFQAMDFSTSEALPAAPASPRPAFPRTPPVDPPADEPGPQTGGSDTAVLPVIPSSGPSPERTRGTDGDPDSAR